MTHRDVLLEALRSLTSHRFRAALASIGVTAGVATIVAALAIADGAERQALADIGTLGMDNVVVRAVATRDARGRAVSPALTLDDMAMLARRLPGVTFAAMRSATGQAATPDRAAAATIVGVTAAWRATGNLSIAKGRWFSARESGARVAVVGAVWARETFGEDDPIARSVLAAGEWRTIIGVVAPAGARGPARAAPDGHDADRTIFLPLQSLDLPLGAGDRGDAVERIVARVPARGDVVRTAASVTALLQARDGIGRGAFETIVPRELLRARLRAERTSRMTMFAFGALALVISGAGIANIMVASVTERSGEIGIRRALGARRSSIVAQFAAEALLLGLGGAPAGIVMGAAGAWIVAALAGWPVAVSTASLAIATALAAIVGLVAGLYPARLAASLTPIEALRSAGQG